jgi:hypothetical protein
MGSGNFHYSLYRNSDSYRNRGYMKECAHHWVKKCWKLRCIGASEEKCSDKCLYCGATREVAKK